jgi:hypothetical protein
VVATPIVRAIGRRGPRGFHAPTFGKCGWVAGEVGREGDKGRRGREEGVRRKDLKCRRLNPSQDLQLII